MKKKITLALTGAVAVGLAVPAMAETTFSGYLFISPMYVTDKVAGKFTDGVDARKPIDQRMRFTMANKINDFASVVWQTETDTVWGDVNAPVNTDQKILETKHLYLTAKIPDSDFGMILGQQAVADKIGKLYMGNDVSAAVFTYGKDALSVALGLAKPTTLDDIYVLQVGYKVSDTLSVNVDLWNYDYDVGSANDYMTAGVGANAAVASINLDAALAFQSGDNASGFIANLGAKTTIDKMAVGGRLVYVADDDAGEQWKCLTETPLAGEGLYFMTFSGGSNKLAGKYAIIDGASSGAGLLGLMANVAMPVDAYTIKGAIGYFQAGDEGDNDMLGTEIAASVSRKLAEKIDVSLFASYVILGDFYKGTGVDEVGAATGDDPDNPYALGLRINAPF